MIIEPGHKVFFDKNGNPLHNGHVYVGVANQDPKSNQVQCYWDAALTIPAAQPLRTTYGHIYKNGAPANVYTSAASYSVATYTSRGTLIYFERDSSNFASGNGNGNGNGNATWGAISGQISSQSDLAAELAAKAPTGHGHASIAISDSTAAGRAMLTALNADAQVALLPIVARNAKGLVPAPGGDGITRFLREDGAFATPPGVSFGVVAITGNTNLTAADHNNRTLEVTATATLTVTTGHGFVNGDVVFIRQRGTGVGTLSGAVELAPGVTDIATFGNHSSLSLMYSDAVGKMIVHSPVRTGGGGGGSQQTFTIGARTGTDDIALTNFFGVDEANPTTAQGAGNWYFINGNTGTRKGVVFDGRLTTSITTHNTGSGQTVTGVLDYIVSLFGASTSGGIIVECYQLTQAISANSWNGLGTIGAKIGEVAGADGRFSLPDAASIYGTANANFGLLFVPKAGNTGSMLVASEVANANPPALADRPFATVVYTRS